MSEIDWTDWVVVAAALRPVITGLEHFPTLEELRELKLDKLADAIETHHGGTADVQARLHSKGKRPDGYYQNVANVDAELRGVIYAEHGAFPTKSRLSEIGLSSLATSLGTYHGGINAARERLGFAVEKKSNGHYKSWAVCEAELREATEQLGHFPTDPELRTLGKHGLLTALFDYHGGLVPARSKLHHRFLDESLLDEYMPRVTAAYQKWSKEGDTLEAFIELVWLECKTEQDLIALLARKPRVLRPPKSRPNGYWQVWENLERELQVVIRKLGHFPTQDELKQQGKQSVSYAINQYNEGFYTVRARMGYTDTTTEKPKGYWNNWENARATLAELERTLGHFPGHGEIEAAGFYGLSDAIRKTNRLGGMPAVRERYGAAKRKGAESGYWNVWDHVATRVRELWTQRGSFPSVKYLNSIGESGLANAITRTHGGYHAIRKRLEAPESNTKPHRFWSVWTNVEQELRRAIKISGEFPTPQWLRANEMSSLAYAISKHHGGFPACRERMGYGRLTEATIVIHMERITAAYMAKAETLAKGFDEFLASILEHCSDEAELTAFLEAT